MITLLRRFGSFDLCQFEEFFTMIFMHTMIQVMTDIKGRGVMMTKTFLLMRFNYY